MCVRVLLCVSSVPASCVHIWFVSCPCFMSLWVKYVPAVFVSLCVNYPLYISPVFWVWFCLVYSLLPRCILSLSPALSYLDVIKYYYLSLYPRLRVPVPPSCMHRDSVIIKMQRLAFNWINTVYVLHNTCASLQTNTANLLLERKKERKIFI